LNVAEIAVELLGVTSALATRKQTDVVRQRDTTQRRRDDMIETAKHVLAPADRNVTLTELAVRAHTTPFHLARVFKATVGISAHDYQVRVRLSQALKNVLDSSESFSDIAVRSGFSSHSHFSLAFRRHVGLTPLQVRRLARSGTAGEVSKIVTALMKSID